MKNIIGVKDSFAVQIKITEFTPSIWGQSALWIGGEMIGNYNEENILGPFLRTLMRLAVEDKELWHQDFENLTCKEAFYKLYPLYNEPETLMNASLEELRKFEFHESLRFNPGENFDDWYFNVLINKGVCNFIWVYNPNRDQGSFDERNDVRCSQVPHSQVRDAYIELCRLIPDDFWPTRLKKL